MTIFSSVNPQVQSIPTDDETRASICWRHNGDARMHRRYREDLALVHDYYPLMSTSATYAPGADVEDHLEAVARAAAAVRAAHQLGTNLTPVPPQADWTEEMMAQRLGPVWPHEVSRHAADPMVDHPALLAYGARWMRRASWGEKGEFADDNDLISLILGRAHAGVGRVVIKPAAAKAGIFTLALRPGMDREDVTSKLIRASDSAAAILHLEGARDAFLLQDWIGMTYEYRAFVVDGRMVTGAGCVEEFTPYHRIGRLARHCSRMRARRGNGLQGAEPSQVVHSPGTGRVFWDFAAEVAAEYPDTYALDLAMNPGSSDTPVVVELNPVPNAGLYACNADDLYLALAQAQDRGY